MKNRPSRDRQAENPDTEEQIGAQTEPSEPQSKDTETPEEVMDRLRGELDEKSLEIEELKDKHVRAYAELENYKKRMSKDRAEWMRYSNEDLLKELLTVMDNLSLAKNHGDQLPAELAKWAEGVSLTIKHFETMLTKFGVTPIEALGVPFILFLIQSVGQGSRRGFVNDPEHVET